MLQIHQKTQLQVVIDDSVVKKTLLEDAIERGDIDRINSSLG